MRPQAILILAVLFVLALVLVSLGPSSYRKVETMQTLEAYMVSLRDNHPEIEHLEVTTLRLLLEGGAKLQLIDVRSADAFAISHIPGAAHAEDLDDVVKLDVPKGNLVIFYGNPDPNAVEIAKAAREVLATQAIHLAGGIFAWANAELPLEDGEGNPASTVEPGAKFQRHLLKKELRHSNP